MSPLSQCNREFLPRLHEEWPMSPTPALKEQNPLGALFSLFSGLVQAGQGHYFATDSPLHGVLTANGEVESISPLPRQENKDRFGLKQ